MFARSNTLSVSDRTELALIRTQIEKALQGAAPDAGTLQGVLKRLDALIVPEASISASRPVARGFFAG